MLFFSITIVGIYVIYLNREFIKKTYYILRYPHITLKVVIHYPGRKFKEFWRLIPGDNLFTVGERKYQYNEDKLINPVIETKIEHKKIESHLIVSNDKNENVSIDGDNTEYIIKNSEQLRNARGQFPEIHYMYRRPEPIIFSDESEKIDFSSNELEKFKESDLFGKLLTLDMGKNLMHLILLITFANTAGIIFIIAKMMGLIA